MEFCVTENLPSPAETLENLSWKIEPHNGPFLAGKAAKPDHGFVELTADQAFGRVARTALPMLWDIIDTTTVIGDLSDRLTVGSSILLLQTARVQEATELANAQGYHPVRTGEFLQALWWMTEHNALERLGGYMFCYTGRQTGYAILAEYNNIPSRPKVEVTFDTHIGHQVAEGYLHSNWNVFCMFVKKP